jgi:AraC family transcriptional regulator, ethanolamine operon transcriptional activator
LLSNTGKTVIGHGYLHVGKCDTYIDLATHKLLHSNSVSSMPNKPSDLQHASPTIARIIRLTDFEQLGPIFSNWQGRFEQLTAGPFRGTLQVLDTGCVRVTAIEGNQRVLLRGRDAAGQFSVHPVIAENASGVWQGCRLTPGQLVVLGADSEVHHCSARQTRALRISFKPKVWETAVQSLLNMEEPLQWLTWAVATPQTKSFAELQRRLHQLLNIGLADPTILGTLECTRIEQECIRSVVAALVPGPVSDLRLSLPRRSRVLRNAEEFMRARLVDPVGAIDLCRELGVSDRTLRLAFQERYGLGPMGYYKFLRLNAVRTRLKSNPHTAIADAAREFGFHHLGNFAADFRRLFGERPSEARR